MHPRRGRLNARRPATRACCIWPCASAGVVRASGQPPDASPAQDFYVGNIRGCLNIPSDRFYPDSAADKVVTAVLRTSPTRVVFHCMFSQQRGPFCASRFAARLPAAAPATPAALPEVLVLQGGWKGWRHAFGDNAALTEGLSS